MGGEAGSYLVLPLLGPSTVRDAPDYAVEVAVNPITWINAPLAASLGVSALGIVDYRSRVESLIRFRNIAALDPYLFTRTAYLQHRESQLHPDQPATTETIHDEDGGPASGPTTGRSK